MPKPHHTHNKYASLHTNPQTVTLRAKAVPARAKEKKKKYKAHTKRYTHSHALLRRKFLNHPLQPLNRLLIFLRLRHQSPILDLHILDLLLQQRRLLHASQAASFRALSVA